MKHTRPEWGDLRPTNLLERLAPLPLVRDATMALGHALSESVDRRTLEHVVLRVATIRQGRYEWVAHTAICLRNGYLSEREIARIAAGPAFLRGADATIVQAVDELLLLNRFGSGSRIVVGDHELAILATTFYYNMLAALTADLRPEPTPTAGLETPALATASLKLCRAS